MSSLNAIEILNRLKDIYELKTDKQLAERLEIPYTTLNSWKHINKVNWDIIHDKCPDLSWDYLRNGNGSPYIAGEKNLKEYLDHDSDQSEKKNVLETTPFTKNSWSQMFFNIVSKSDVSKDATPKEKISILFVDDEENNLVSFKANFREKYRILTAKSGIEALQTLEDFDIDIIITDQRMPEMTGIEFLEKAQEVKPETMRILMTGFSEIDVVKDAINKGKIYYFLGKPWNNEEIDRIVTLAYAVYIERKTNKIKTDELEQLNEQYEYFLRQKLASEE